MNKTKSIIAIIMLMTVILTGFTACNNKTKNKGNNSEQACCKKDGEACGKDSAACAKTEKDACCKKDSTKTEN
jgi:hypothetical protein